ncbi:MAG: hypothetical protein Q3994_02955 [Prevotella sp.]|nr:hypothetical protein [Prevotella sp.]
MIMFLLAFASTCKASVNYTLSPDAQRDVIKITKKTMKQLTKEGWQVIPGADKTFEQQVEQIVIFKYFLSERFVCGEGNGVDDDMELARQQASTQAFMELAELLNARVESETQQLKKTHEMNDEEAHSLTSSVLSAIVESEENFDSSSLVFTFCRTDKHGKIEIRTIAFYDISAFVSRLALDLVGWERNYPSHE